jgi:sulfopyruvate decarboxylase subunit beta
MLRADALRAIYPELEDQIVVTIMGAVAAELYTLGHRANFFYLEQVPSGMRLEFGVAHSPVT